MSDYGFIHNGTVYTPNGTPNVDPAQNTARNQAVEQGELSEWETQPARFFAYYNARSVTTWLGTVLGHITGSRIYRHNLGGRFISLNVEGTNGAKYYGRASYDNGQCIVLHKKR